MFRTLNTYVRKHTYMKEICVIFTTLLIEIATVESTFLLGNCFLNYTNGISLAAVQCPFLTLFTKVE